MWRTVYRRACAAVGATIVSGALVVASASAAQAATTACSDGIDNDADGRTDYPADPACGWAGDTSEGGTCPPVAPDVIACLDIGALAVTYTVDRPGLLNGREREIAAYGDLYRFDLPGGLSTSVQCVTPGVDGLEPDACAIAGGTFVRREIVFLRQSADEPDLATTTDLGTVRVCRAELTATVRGAGVSGVAVLTPCSSSLF